MNAFKRNDNETSGILLLLLFLVYHTWYTGNEKITQTHFQKSYKYICMRVALNKVLLRCTSTDVVLVQRICNKVLLFGVVFDSGLTYQTDLECYFTMCDIVFSDCFKVSAPPLDYVMRLYWFWKEISVSKCVNSCDSWIN